MGKSMYNYGKQTKEKDRQLKQIAKNLKRSLAKQQRADIKENTLTQGAVMPERKEDE
jgi:hypothetical protein